MANWITILVTFSANNCAMFQPISSWQTGELIEFYQNFYCRNSLPPVLTQTSDTYIAAKSHKYFDVLVCFRTLGPCFSHSQVQAFTYFSQGLLGLVIVCFKPPFWVYFSYHHFLQKLISTIHVQKSWNTFTLQKLCQYNTSLTFDFIGATFENPRLVTKMIPQVLPNNDGTYKKNLSAYNFVIGQWNLYCNCLVWYCQSRGWMTLSIIGCEVAFKVLSPASIANPPHPLSKVPTHEP